MLLRPVGQFHSLTKLEFSRASGGKPNDFPHPPVLAVVSHSVVPFASSFRQVVVIQHGKAISREGVEKNVP